MITTAQVLEVVGLDGVIVGSVARGKQNPKDIDIVVKGRGIRCKNPVFSRLFREFPDYTDSEVPGQVTVTAEPLGVELFEYTCYHLDDPTKNAGRVSYRTARKHAEQTVYLGVQVWMMKRSS